MIPSSTIDFDVVEARQNGRSAVAGRVLFSFTSPAKIELDEPPPPPTTSRRSSWAFLAGKKKFDPEKSYETFYRENVPEKPLQTHHDKLTSIISDSSVTTMGIFP
jgi:hypothetical protein